MGGSLSGDHAIQEVFMLRVRSLLLFVAIPLWLGACSADDATGPEPGDPTGLAFSQGAGPVDISGEWSLSRVLQVTAPDWVAELIFGIEAEGPVTVFRCESVGSMTLSQAGSEFTGTAAWDSNACETRGGQVFSAGFPPITIEGQISGRSLRFDWIEPGGLVCPQHGRIGDLANGVAVVLSGTGRCIVPGHPLSPVPLDPPPAGTSKTLVWEAVRP
jgi:hypothetical protein